MEPHGVAESRVTTYMSRITLVSALRRNLQSPPQEPLRSQLHTFPIITDSAVRESIGNAGEMLVWSDSFSITRTNFSVEEKPLAW